MSNTWIEQETIKDIIVNEPEIDYKKLYIKCIEYWVECEGTCWDVDSVEGLNKKERSWANEVNERIIDDYFKKYSVNCYNESTSSTSSDD